MIICIDPGHGGTDSGTEGFGVSEKNIVLDIAIKLKNLLEKENIEVVLTRDRDVTLTPEDRVNFINQSGCDMAISIHCNGGPVSAKGVETIYGHGSQIGQRLAENILEQIVKLGVAKRKAYYRLNAKRENYYFIIREVKPVSVIVETVFLTNPSDNQLLSQNPFRKKLANAIATGIFNTIGMDYLKKEHWAKEYFETIKKEGLVQDDHVLDEGVTWGELSVVLTRLLDRMEE